MKVTVLMDLNRLKTLTTFRSFFTQDNSYSWELGDYTFKFIVLSHNELVIAPMTDHKALYRMYQAWNLTLEEAKQFNIDASYFPARWEMPIIAAGSVSFGGQITDWKSDGFRLTTPTSMQDEITEAITELFRTDAMTIK